MMARYFFHLESTWSSRDEDGAELTDIHAAKSYAVQYLVDHVSHQPEHLWDAETCEVRVTDADDLTLLTVAMVGTLAPAISAPLRM
jgi:hypothetical protein